MTLAEYVRVHTLPSQALILQPMPASIQSLALHCAKATYFYWPNDLAGISFPVCANNLELPSFYFHFLKCEYSFSLLTVFWRVIELVQIYFNKKNTDNGKYMKVIYYKVSGCFWEKVQWIGPFSQGKGSLDMLDMLKHFRVLAQVFTFTFVKSLESLHSLSIMGKL